MTEPCPVRNTSRGGRFNQFLSGFERRWIHACAQTIEAALRYALAAAQSQRVVHEGLDRTLLHPHSALVERGKGELSLCMLLQGGLAQVAGATGQINFANQKYVRFVKPVREKYLSSVFRKNMVLSSRPVSARGANASSRS